MLIQKFTRRTKSSKHKTVSNQIFEKAANIGDWGKYSFNISCPFSSGKNVVIEGSVDLMTWDTLASVMMTQPTDHCNLYIQEFPIETQFANYAYRYFRLSFSEMYGTYITLQYFDMTFNFN